MVLENLYVETSVTEEGYISTSTSLSFRLNAFKTHRAH